MARWLGTHFARKLPERMNLWLCRFIRKKFRWALSPELFCIFTKEWNCRLQINLLEPKTYNDKLNFLMLHYRNPLLVQLADKYAVREYIAQTIGESYLPKLFGVWEKPSEIIPEVLPDRFVLKTNHGCHTNLFCTDKSAFHWPSARKKLAKWLKIDFSKISYEWQYRDIPRRIIAEEYLDDPGYTAPRDFKFLCLDGKVRAIMLFSDRDTDTRINVYTPQWEFLPEVHTSFPNSPEHLSERPANLDEMIRCAERLAAPFPQVRVDFYDLGNRRIVFGELTFSYGSGRSMISPRSYNLELGSYLDLASPLCQQFLSN